MDLSNMNGAASLVRSGEEVVGVLLTSQKGAKSFGVDASLRGVSSLCSTGEDGANLEDDSPKLVALEGKRSSFRHYQECNEATVHPMGIDYREAVNSFIGDDSEEIVMPLQPAIEKIDDVINKTPKKRERRRDRKPTEEAGEVDSIKLVRKARDVRPKGTSSKQNNEGGPRSCDSPDEEFVLPLQASSKDGDVNGLRLGQGIRPRRSERNRFEKGIDEVDSVKLALKGKRTRLQNDRKKAIGNNEAILLIAQEIVNSFQDEGIEETLMPLQSDPCNKDEDGTIQPAPRRGRGRRDRAQRENDLEVDSVKLFRKAKGKKLQNNRKRDLVDRTPQEDRDELVEHPNLTVDDPAPSTGTPETDQETSHEEGSPQLESSRSESPNEGSSDGSSNQNLSTEEIRMSILEHIPQSLKEKIPEEAWDEIFGRLNDGSKSHSSPRQTEETEFPSNDAVLDSIGVPIDDDDLSECSDITEWTSASNTSEMVPDEMVPDISDTRSLSSWSFYNKETFIPLSGMSCGKESPMRVQSQPKSIIEGLETPESTLRWASVPCSDATPPPVKRTESSRRVSFDGVEVRYYENILSDNPGVRSGPAVGIGWRFHTRDALGVDEWESMKPTPRRSSELAIPRPVRETMLKDRGYSDKDIAHMIRVITKAKNNRRQTINNLGVSGMEEAIENAKRKVKSLLSLSRSRKGTKKP